MSGFRPKKARRYKAPTARPSGLRYLLPREGRRLPADLERMAVPVEAYKLHLRAGRKCD